MYLFPIKYAIQLAILKHLYFIFFIFFILSSQLFHAYKRLLVFAMSASGFELISSIRLDGRKVLQSVESGWSICILSLKPTFYHLSRGIIKDARRTHTTEIMSGGTIKSAACSSNVANAAIGNHIEWLIWILML